MITPPDVLYAWDIDRGGSPSPVIGGEAKLIREGDRRVRIRRRGGGYLWERRVGNKVATAVVDSEGVLSSRRALDLDRSATPTNDDSVRFGPASEVAWSYANVDTNPVKSSAFDNLPGDGEAREFTGDGSGAVQVRQNIGTFGAGILETTLILVENTAGGDEVWWGLFNSTTSSFEGRASYNFATGATAMENGTGTPAVIDSGEYGPNGQPWALLALRGGGPSGDDRRFWIYPGGNTGVAGNGCTIHYAHHVELSYATSPIPYVGPPETRPGDQFWVTPGPYRPDVTHVFLVEWVAGMPHGDTRAFERTVFHGDGSKPWALLWQSDATPGKMRFDWDNAASEGASIQDIDLGAPEPGELIQVVYAFDAVDGTMRLIGRAEGEAVKDSGASTPASFTTPSSLGENNRIVYNEDADLSGSRRGRHLFLRHLGVRGSQMDTDPFTGAAEDVLNELLDIPITPDRAGHVTP